MNRSLSGQPINVNRPVLIDMYVVHDEFLRTARIILAHLLHKGRSCGIAALLALLGCAAGADETMTWYERNAAGDIDLHLYVFWSAHCPHCTDANQFVETIRGTPWLKVHSLEVTGSSTNARRFVELAESLGGDSRYVPAFVFCGTVSTGFDGAETTGKLLMESLANCRADPVRFMSEESGVGAQNVALPDWLGIDAETAALPLTTVVIAGLDAFNPCAFFVLLFLLSLMVHAGSRQRMLLVGGVFVLFSGIVYFVFMAAWLNVFLLAGELSVVTRLAGTVAVFMAVVNIKDYFWYRQGVTLSIPDRAKPNLYQRVRGLIGAERLSYLLTGTVLLAIAANSYELLCTAGFPMVYTRILTLHELAPATYYLYLALYNLVYITPLLIIVTLFALRFSKRPLSEREGRTLKLLSGMMMLALGLALIAQPEILSGLRGALALMLVALLTSACIVGIDRWRNREQRAKS